MKHLFYGLMCIAAFHSLGLLIAADKKPSVVTQDVSHKPLADRLLYPASLAAFRVVPVHTDAEGLVSDLRVDLGQSVTSGQTLALVTNPDPSSGFKPYALTAPISGIITSIDIAVGDRLTRARVVLVIADLRSFKVKIHLTAADLLSLKPRDQGLLNLQGKSFKVRIRVMSPMIDPATGTAACELEIMAPSSELKALVPGSMGQVVFETNRRDGIVVPEDAIVYKGKDPFVIRVTAKSTAEYVPVQILKQAVGQVEIKGNLKSGDPIVTGSTGFILEGEALETQKDESNPAARKG